MIAARYNMEIEQGGTFVRTFTFDDEIDLSDYDSVRMQIRRMPGKAIIWNSEESAANNGSITIDGQDIVLDIPASVTADFEFEEAGYDIELVKDGTPEIVDKPIKGKILLHKEYTK